MKNVKRFCVAIAMITVTAAGFLFFFGEKIKILYKSLNSFKDDNLAYTFQHTKEIISIGKRQHIEQENKPRIYKQQHNSQEIKPRPYRQ